MPKGKIFSPQYPSSVEREYLRFLNVYSKAYILLMRSGLKEMIPGLKKTAKAELPRVDSVRMDADIADSITKLFKFVDDKMKARFTDAYLQKQIKSMIVGNNKHTKKQVMKMVNTQTDEDLDLEPLMGDHKLKPYFQNVVDMNVSLIKSIPKYKEDSFKNQLIALITKDARVEEIQKVIEKKFNLTKSRAALIAQDQVGKLNGVLEKYRQEQLGVTRYIWRTSGDSRVREDHRRLEGKTFSWNKPPVIDRTTGERGNPKEGIRCRCWAEPVLEDVIDI
jgi:SPP1 gp7 family putative phage head morphogenesis protein